MASASAKKPPVRTASIALPSVSVPATAPVPSRIATRASHAGAEARREAPFVFDIAAEDERRGGCRECRAAAAG